MHTQTHTHANTREKTTSFRLIFSPLYLYLPTHTPAQSYREESRVYGLGNKRNLCFSSLLGFVYVEKCAQLD